MPDQRDNVFRHPVAAQGDVLALRGTMGSAYGRSATWRNPDGESAFRIVDIATSLRTGDQDFATATSDTMVALGPARGQRILEEPVRAGQLVRKRAPPQRVEARDHPFFA
eukprot:8263705-Pyramimonas_sp.AAC.1